VSHINDVSDLPEYLRAEVTHFFENYKTLENKKVVIDQFLSKDRAYKIIEESIRYYKENFK
jgi:inorganic pyrophosphatase